MDKDKFQTLSLERVLELGDDDLSLPDDVDVFEKNVNENISCHCFYDLVMEAFVLRVFKTIDAVETGIALRVEALRRLLALFPRLLSVASRYRSRDMLINYRFEISKMVFVSIGKFYFIFILLCFNSFCV